ALFLLGLRDLQLGRFTDAEDLLKAFVASQPPQSLSWITEYRPIARKYLPDLKAMLAWRARHGSAKNKTELSNALRSLQELMANLQKKTAISAEAMVDNKTLIARLRGGEAVNKSAQEKQHRDLLAREPPELNAALRAYRQLAAKYEDRKSTRLNSSH